jgi:hypothetical protein
VTGVVVRDLVATRLACLCLVDQRPRGLTFDDHLVRAALAVDLALGGALSEADDAVDLDEELAAELGLAPIAAAVATVGSLDAWIEHGGLAFADWAQSLVEGGVWTPLPRAARHPVRRRYEDCVAPRTQADRALGRRPSADGASTGTLAVLALGSVSGVFGDPRPPRPWLVPAMGDVSWAGQLAVDKLVAIGTTMRIAAITV